MNQKLSLIAIVGLVVTFVSCGKKNLENQNFDFNEFLATRKNMIMIQVL